MDHREQRQVTFFNYLLHKKSSSSGGFAVDLGARWIHGKDNSVFSYTKSNGILGDKIKIEDRAVEHNELNSKLKDTTEELNDVKNKLKLQMEQRVLYEEAHAEYMKALKCSDSQFFLL